MKDIEFDWERERRTGFPEVVLCTGKRPVHIAQIVSAAIERDRELLLTRLEPDALARLPEDVATRLDYDEASRTAILWNAKVQPERLAGVVIVAAGTSDLAVALEAQRTLAFNGFEGPVIADVGVSGLWRLLDKIEVIRASQVVIAVAGMEGALFSVLAGLVEAPLIAVPTSVGHGVAAGGWTALCSALGGCAPGVMVVNIDDGFGAAAAAVKIMRVAARQVDRARTSLNAADGGRLERLE